MLLVAAGGASAVAFQRSAPNNPSPNYPSSIENTNNSNSSLSRMSGLDDQSALRQMEEKRGKALNTERQRMIQKEASQLVQAAADLQASVSKGIDGAGREEQARRAEAIEKVARDVKERMKGGR